MKTRSHTNPCCDVAMMDEEPPYPADHDIACRHHDIPLYRCPVPYTKTDQREILAFLRKPSNWFYLSDNNKATVRRRAKQFKLRLPPL